MEKQNNPALKLEEIKVGNWIWDNKLKIYLQVEDVAYNGFTGKYDIYSKQYRDLGVDIDGDMFSENRYYKYQTNTEYYPESKPFKFNLL